MCLMYTLMSSCAVYTLSAPVYHTVLLASCVRVHPHELMYDLSAPLYPHLIMALCAHVHPHELMYNLSVPLYPHVILYISFIQFIRNGQLVQVSLLEILVFLTLSICVSLLCCTYPYIYMTACIANIHVRMPAQHVLTTAQRFLPENNNNGLYFPITNLQRDISLFAPISISLFSMLTVK